MISLPLPKKYDDDEACKRYWKGWADIWNVAEIDDMNIFRSFRVLLETLRSEIDLVICCRHLFTVKDML